MLINKLIYKILSLQFGFTIVEILNFLNDSNFIYQMLDLKEAIAELLLKTIRPNLDMIGKSKFVHRWKP